MVRTDFLRILSGVGPGEGVFTTAVDTPQGSVAEALTAEIITALCMGIAHAALPAVRCSVQRLDMQTNDLTGIRRRSRAQTLTVSIATDKARPAVELVLTPVLVDALLAGRPAVASREPMTGRRSASAEQPVALSAVLGSATVSWRDLTELCIGDVIVLDQALSAPCVLHIGGTTAVADAQLGHIDNALAAQVTRIRPAKAS
jgi:flagellar motor switch/type III secretory pathway protein FliN